MIIHFDFKSSKIILMQQQNDKKSFVVDFLFNDSATSLSDAIEKICQNGQILKILRNEKNAVILPNQLVCIDSLTVPFEKRETREYMLSKFDLLYGGKNNYVICDEIFAKNKNVAVFSIFATKANNILQILSTFAKFGVKIKAISFEAAAVLESVLSENKQLIKENILVIKIGENDVEFIISAKEKIFAYQSVELDSNLFAKKYAKYIKNNYKKLSEQFDVEQIDVEINKINLPKSTKKYEFLPIFIKELQDFCKNAEFGFEFDQVIILDENNLLGDTNFGTKIDFEKAKELVCTGKNCFVEKKKGLF